MQFSESALTKQNILSSITTFFSYLEVPEKLISICPFLFSSRKAHTVGFNLKKIMGQI